MPYCKIVDCGLKKFKLKGIVIGSCCSNAALPKMDSAIAQNPPLDLKEAKRYLPAAAIFCKLQSKNQALYLQAFNFPGLANCKSFEL
jgi:hypothetical protein